MAGRPRSTKPTAAVEDPIAPRMTGRAIIEGELERERGERSLVCCSVPVFEAVGHFRPVFGGHILGHFSEEASIGGQNGALFGALVGHFLARKSKNFLRTALCFTVSPSLVSPIHTPTVSSRCMLGVSGAREGPVVARNKRWYVFFSFFFLFFFRLTLSSPKRTPLQAPMREPHEIVIIKYFRFCLLFLHQSAEDHASARRAVCALLLIFDDL